MATTLSHISQEELDYYAKVPKVHLHSHILGMVPADTLLSLADKNGVALDSRTPEELYRYYNFQRFVEILSHIAASIQTEEDYSRVIYECVERAYREEHVLYSELAVQTSYHLLYGSSYQQIIDGFSDGIRRAERDFGVQARLILGLNRQLPPPIATHIVRQAIAYPSPYVIGIGLEDFEGYGPPEDFAEAYSLAKSEGLHRTVHAGEHGPAQNVITALTRLEGERIDHGYRAAEDASLAYRLAENHVHFAVCPTVSSRQGWLRPTGHIIKQMYDCGMWLSINTDDPAIVGTDLNREYALAARYLGVGRREMTGIARQAIDAAWLSPEEKAKLRARFDREMAEAAL